MSSLYDVLGTQRHASSKEIKQAWIRRARETHPDRPGGDAAAFRRVQSAYETLSDPRRRHLYDAASGGSPQSPDPEQQRRDARTRASAQEAARERARQDQQRRERAEQEARNRERAKRQAEDRLRHERADREAKERLRQERADRDAAERARQERAASAEAAARREAEEKERVRREEEEAVAKRQADKVKAEELYYQELSERLMPSIERRLARIGSLWKKAAQDYSIPLSHLVWWVRAERILKACAWLANVTFHTACVVVFAWAYLKIAALFPEQTAIFGSEIGVLPGIFVATAFKIRRDLRGTESGLVEFVGERYSGRLTDIEFRNFLLDNEVRRLADSPR